MTSVWTSAGCTQEAAVSSEMIVYGARSQQLTGVELQQLPLQLELGGGVGRVLGFKVTNSMGN